MQAGQNVEVTEYGGRKLIRRVVADKGIKVIVCNEEEWKKANKEKRMPRGIGFGRDAVRELRSHGG